MLRDSTEKFAAEMLQTILKATGEKSSYPNQSFQLIKFERITPDSFVWLLRNDHTYVVTISDMPEDLYRKDQLVAWVGNGITEKDLKPLTDEAGNIDYQNSYDTVNIYKLPENFDYEAGVN